MASIKTEAQKRKTNTIVNYMKLLKLSTINLYVIDIKKESEKWFIQLLLVRTKEKRKFLVK